MGVICQNKMHSQGFIFISLSIAHGGLIQDIKYFIHQLNTLNKFHFS